MNQDSPKRIQHTLLHSDPMTYENAIYSGVAVKKKLRMDSMWGQKLIVGDLV